MKVSLTLQDGDAPVLLRGKIPITALGFPLFCGFAFGKKAEDAAFRVGSVPVVGPSCELAYRPKDAAHPLAVVLKTGFGRCAILTMSAEFDPKQGSAPSFRLCFKPRLGDFAATRRFSSASVKDAATSSSSAFGPANTIPAFPSSSELENPWMSAFHSHSGMGGGGGSDVIHTVVDTDWEHLGGGAAEPPLAPLYSGPATPPSLDPPPPHTHIVAERIPSTKPFHHLLTGSCIHARTAFAFPFNTRLTMRWKMHHPPIGNAYASSSASTSNTDDATLKGALLKLAPSLPILLVDKLTFDRPRITERQGRSGSDYRPSEQTVSHLGESLALVKEALHEIRTENRALHQAMEMIRAEMGKKSKGFKQAEKLNVEENHPPSHQKGSVF